jgi:hypothetical protein
MDTYQFTPLEQTSYTRLHDLIQASGQAGWVTFERELGHFQADQLLNRWADSKVIRLTWLNGSFVVHTFKKYAVH